MLFNGINHMKMVPRGLMKQYCEVKKLIFHQHFLNMEISFNTQRKGLKFCLCIFHYHMEGSVSQIFDLGLRFCFMNSRTLNFKK